MRKTLVSIFTTMAILLPATATEASTHPAVVSSSNVVLASTPWDNDVTSFLDFVGGCAGVGASGWAAYKSVSPQAGAVVLVLAAVRCSIGVGATLGEWNVSQICWRSRHWDVAARATVWVMTFGQYTRC